MMRIKAILLVHKELIKIFKLIKIKKVNFINIKLFVRSKPNVFIGKIIFGNVELFRKNSTHDSSKIFYHIIMFLELLFLTIFSIEFVPTSKPYLKSDTTMLFKIINNSKSSNDIKEFIITTH